MYRYGGVWIDSTVILLEDLNWLDHLASNPDVVNSDGEAPEVFQFYYSFFGSYNTRNIKGKEFLLSPGTESWFFASVKEAELLKLLIRQF